MIEFQVDDMTCGHCAGVISKAVKGVEPAAQVDIDLAAHCVRVRGDVLAAGKLEAAIKDAGYTPARV